MKFYLLYPKVPLNPCLFPTFLKPFSDKGHSFVLNIEDADCILFDLHTRIADYDQKEIDLVIEKGKFIATFDEFDKGGMSNLEWPEPLTQQQYEVFNHIRKGGCKAVHFCRLLDKTKSYPENLYPYEKGVLYEEPMVTEDELFNREYDICFIANDAPQRERLRQILLGDGRLKCNIILGAEKIPFDQWVNEHKKAKMFITWSAGGFTDERVQALFSIAVQVREDTNQLLMEEYTHLKNCIKLNSAPTKADIDTVVRIANDSVRLHQIYSQGYNFVKTYYTQDYIANNILKIILNNL